MSAPAPRLSRRSAVLTVGAVIAGALEACAAKPIPTNVPISRHTRGARADIALLDVLLDRERYAIAAYSAAIPVLGRRAARAGKQFLAHELAHASELEGLIKQAGGKPARPPAFYDLGTPRDERQLLELLHGAEHGQLRAYLQAVSLLTPARLRAAAAAILANEAQHTAVLRAELGLDPIPTALVTAAA